MSDEVLNLAHHLIFKIKDEEKIDELKIKESVN